MSRSYRRVYVYKEKNNRFAKRMANRAVRKTKSVANGSQFKKYYCSWIICDYRMYEGTAKESLKKFRREWENSENLQRRFPTWEQAYRAWRRWNIK